MYNLPRNFRWFSFSLFDTIFAIYTDHERCGASADSPLTPEVDANRARDGSNGSSLSGSPVVKVSCPQVRMHGHAGEM
jgi:hypothetical protein